MMSMGSHDHQARLKDSYLLQQNLGRFQMRVHHMKLALSSVSIQKLSSELGGFSLPVVAAYGQQMDRLTTGQTQELKRL